MESMQGFSLPLTQPPMQTYWLQNEYKTHSIKHNDPDCIQQFEANECMQWNTHRFLARRGQNSQCKLTSCRMNTKQIQSNITFQIECSNSKQINVCNGIRSVLACHRNERKCKLTSCRMNRKHSQSNIKIQIECSNSKRINV